MQGEVSGFYGAPITKALISASVGVSVAAAAARIDSALLVRSPFWAPQLQYISHGLLLASTQDILFGAALMYAFRALERRTGSRKFAAAVLIMSGLTMGIQATAASLMRRQILHPGSTGLLYAISVVYLITMPKGQSFTLAGSVSLSDKLYIYLMLFQIAITNGPDSYISAASGFMAGVIYKALFDHVAFPKSVANFFSKAFGWFLSRPPPLAASGQRARTVSGTGVPYEDRLIGGEDEDPRAFIRAAGARAGQRPPAGENFEVSEAHIQELMNMGFSRSDAVQALTVARNNLQQAVNILLTS